MTDDRWMLDRILKLEREAGANEARLDGHDEAIERIEIAVKNGFANQETKTAEQINHIRGEIKGTADGLYAALDEIKQERKSFGTALSRVGAAIILAVIAAAAANYAAISPQVAGMTARAIEHIQP